MRLGYGNEAGVVVRYRNEAGGGVVSVPDPPCTHKKKTEGKCQKRVWCS